MAGGRPSVFAIPAGISFARTLAEGVKARVGDDPLALADVSILVPTRRAVRTLREEFTAMLGGAALGPQIRALGDLDEDGIVFDPGADDLDLPPAMAPLRRHLLLATLVERWGAARGNALPFAQSLADAGRLGQFLDEAVTQGADLAKLKTLAPEALAEHWQEVAKFLDILASAWPKMLADAGRMEQAARRDEILRRHAERLKAAPPAQWVIAAGSTGSIPATANLLKVIASLPLGAVVLPGLDTNLDAASWDALDAGHGQFGLKQLLQHLGAARDEVRGWTDAARDDKRAARVRFLSEALRPPPTTDAWRDLADKKRGEFADALNGLSLIEAAHPREEAMVVAIALRQALEIEGRTAALVTPDRGLARRVAAELSRWDIAIDDSAGTALARTPPGAFLALLAQAAAERFAPLPLLSLLKHPLAAGGEERARFRAKVRELERSVLRGIRPPPGIAGIEAALAQTKTGAGLRSWVERLGRLFAPLADAMAAKDAPLGEIARAHAEVAEKLAATPDSSGANALWRGEAGEAAANLIAELVEESTDVGISDGRQYAEVFRDLAEARAVRPRYGSHPRLAILGPLEARLQQFDLVILSGLNEGTWPAEASSDPWLSRRMRAELGLEAPERRTGLAAHDFFALAAGPEIVLTRAVKAEGAPATASRWVLRLKQLAKGLELEESLRARNALLEWARQIDRAERTPRVPRPEPRPPVEARPRKLSVTRIETWLRDPYAIYAQYILRLRPLDPIDADPGPRERGIAIHRALEKFFAAFPKTLPQNALDELVRIGEETFSEYGATPAVLALWRPRFARAAQWFLDYERAQREIIARIAVEPEGALSVPGPAGDFTLTGRADRIDCFADGAATISDYKSGRVPSQKQIKLLHAPQLPLEAAMLLGGGFEGLTADNIRALVHIQLSGASPPGKAEPYAGDATAKAGEALAKLRQRIARYDELGQPYRSREFVERTTDEGDYDHLARLREWSFAGSEE